MHAFSSLASVGLVSDTHGLLRRSVILALHGVDLILHAGDIGKPEVLDGLSAVAPVIAVRGKRGCSSASSSKSVSLFSRCSTVKFGSTTMPFTAIEASSAFPRPGLFSSL